MFRMLIIVYLLCDIILCSLIVLLILLMIYVNSWLYMVWNKKRDVKWNFMNGKGFKEGICIMMDYGLIFGYGNGGFFFMFRVMFMVMGN